MMVGLSLGNTPEGARRIARWEFWLFVVGPSVIAVALYLAFIVSMDVAGNTEWIMIGGFLLMIAVSLIALSICEAPFEYYEPKNPPSASSFDRLALVWPDGGARDVTGQSFCRWEVPKKAKLVRYYPGETTAMKVCLVDNSIVRTLVYQVRIEVRYKDNTMLSRYLVGLARKERIFVFVERILYGFNARHDAELLQFNNPRGGAQQIQFEGLMRKHLSSELANSGLVISSASFNLQ